jgi:kinesin family member 18/19
MSVDLKLNEDPVRGMVVQGITEYGADSADEILELLHASAHHGAPPSPHRYGADSADEILELLHRGNMHRAVEPTAANQVSSRSHAVLQITVEQSERTAHVTGNVRSTR